jgi:hypothetical protein
VRSPGEGCPRQPCELLPSTACPPRLSSGPPTSWSSSW